MTVFVSSNFTVARLLGFGKNLLGQFSFSVTPFVVEMQRASRIGDTEPVLNKMLFHAKPTKYFPVNRGYKLITLYSVPLSRVIFRSLLKMVR